MNDNEELRQRMGALRTTIRDLSLPEDVRMRAADELLDLLNLLDPELVRGVGKRYLPEAAEGVRHVVENASDPEVRRAAKEMLAQIEFHSRIDRLVDGVDGTSTGNPP